MKHTKSETAKVAVTVAIYTTIVVDSEVLNIPSKETGCGYEIEYDTDDLQRKVDKWVNEHSGVIGDDATAELLNWEVE